MGNTCKMETMNINIILKRWAIFLMYLFSAICKLHYDIGILLDKRVLHSYCEWCTYRCQSRTMLVIPKKCRSGCKSRIAFSIAGGTAPWGRWEDARLVWRGWIGRRWGGMGAVEQRFSTGGSWTSSNSRWIFGGLQDVHQPACARVDFHAWCTLSWKRGIDLQWQEVPLCIPKYHS